jgi:hypothetical protein
VQDKLQTEGASSVLIEVGDIEIEIRRSNKAVPVRSKSVSHRLNNPEKHKLNGEKPKTSQAYWDYSPLHGETGFLRCNVLVLQTNDTWHL